MDTNGFLKKLISNNNFKRCLEFGSGYSTRIIRKYLKHGSTLTSLEIPKYYKKNIKKLKNTKYHKIEKVKIKGNKYKINLSGFKPKGIYDFIYIDFPNDKILYECKSYFERICSITNLQGKEFKYGIQSAWIMGYIWDHIDKNSIIVVDHRFASVLAYQRMFSINIENYGKFSNTTLFKNLSTITVITKK